MLKKFPFVLMASVLVIFHASHVSAASFNSLAQQKLLSEATEYVVQQLNPENNENIHVKALPMDSRVRVKSCPIPLNFSLAKKRSYTRQFPVKVTCEAELAPWKLFVQVKVSEYVEALVTTEHIVKGEVIDDSKVAIRLVEKSRVKSSGTSSNKTINGGRAMRNIPRGYQIGNMDVCLVCKGDDVAIIAKSTNMMIKTSGTAIENGSFGESIKVKNNSSERIVKGVIGELRQIYVNL